MQTSHQSSYQGTVVYHDEIMKKNICHFFPKFGHFEYIMRYESKIFEKKKKSFHNFGFKSPI
jgi:hypothetical protein